MATAATAALVAFAAGCMGPPRESSIPPLPAADPGLGPGTVALSSGPGYKGSPVWSPSGDRIAFTVDGYAVDKPAGPGASRQDLRRWTTRDFVAEEIGWSVPEGGLAVLGAAGPADEAEETPSKLYKAGPDEGSFEGSFGVQEVSSNVLAMGRGPGADGLVVSVKTGPKESRLAPLSGGRLGRRIFADAEGGLISGFSLSPDGRGVVTVLRLPDHHGGAHEMRVFDLRGGVLKRTVRLPEGLEVVGTPQWTDRGVYYVAGRKEAAENGNAAAALYGLYRLPPGPGGVPQGEPEPAPGVGRGFVAASVRASPEGGKIAVVGRLTPESPTNLYVQNLSAGDFEAVTANEDMEIKTGPDDLAWSPDGESIAVVARGAPSEGPVVHDAPADALLRDFYNLYKVPVGGAR